MAEIPNAAMQTKRSTKMMMMQLRVMVVVVVGLVICSCQVGVQAQAPSAAPAPAPAPSFVNVTQLLVYGGDYSTFVSLMIETKVDVIFQSMANESTTGITIFAPTNEAFQSKLATSLLKNLKASEKVSLVEYHALNNYQSLQDLQNTNPVNQTATLASYNNGGGRYMLNISFGQLGVVQVKSDWTLANVTSMVYSQSPVSIFAVNQVLLPEDIFGLPSPSPAPAPSSGGPTPTPAASVPSASSLSSGPSGRNNDASFAPSPFIFFSPFATLLISLFSFTCFMTTPF